MLQGDGKDFYPRLFSKSTAVHSSMYDYRSGGPGFEARVELSLGIGFLCQEIVSNALELIGFDLIIIIYCLQAERR